MLAEAKRGFIYEYDDGKNINKRYVLVVSNNTRSTDRMVSVIMLGDSSLGHDVVKITHEGIGGTRYLHCGMLTYAKRECLIEEIGEITPEEMNQTEYMISRELALGETITAERDFYKNIYNELLDKLVNTNIGE